MPRVSLTVLAGLSEVTVSSCRRTAAVAVTAALIAAGALLVPGYWLRQAPRGPHWRVFHVTAGPEMMGLLLPPALTAALIARGLCK